MSIKYSTIVADPPWPYDNSDRGAIIKTVKVTGEIAKGVQAHDTYKTMSLADILALPVKERAEKNAHLYLWTTNAFLVEAHEIARAWGFEPKTVVTWVKTRHADGQPSMKTGYYYRGATEHVLFCVRGSLRLRGPAHATAFFAQRLPHSQKPEYSYRMIEEQSPGPYLELFARRPRDGWDVWGNEVESTIDMTTVDSNA